MQVRTNLSPMSRHSARAPVADLIALARPRLLAEALAVVAAAYVVALPKPFDGVRFGLLLLGGMLVLSGASAINQLLERDADGKMRRTRGRPLPRRRIGASAAGMYGSALCIGGIGVLALGVGVLSAAVALAGLATYLGLYTPLKRRSPIAVPVGAAAGALPALMGWAAATGTIGIGAGVLFLIVYVWQLPHFLAIGWLYRRDYEAAGFRMVPGDQGVDSGSKVARWILTANLLLLPISLLPTILGLSGQLYLVGAALLGLIYLMAGYGLYTQGHSTIGARRLLRVSVVYLPALLALLAIDRWL